MAVYLAALLLCCAAPLGAGGGAPGAAGDLLRPEGALRPHEILWSPATPREEVFGSFWEKQWCHLRGADRAQAGLALHADLLPLNASVLRSVIGEMDRETAAAQVKTAQLSGPSGCSADGRACVDTALAAADTLIFDGGEFWLPSVHSLVSSWKREFGVYIGSNFYITPPGKQAFGFHSDHTDVFVLQLEGEKLW